MNSVLLPEFLTSFHNQSLLNSRNASFIWVANCADYNSLDIRHKIGRDIRGQFSPPPFQAASALKTEARGPQRVRDRLRKVWPRGGRGFLVPAGQQSIAG